MSARQVRFDSLKKKAQKILEGDYSYDFDFFATQLYDSFKADLANNKTPEEAMKNYISKCLAAAVENDWRNKQLLYLFAWGDATIPQDKLKFIDESDFGSFDIYSKFMLPGFNVDNPEAVLTIHDLCKFFEKVFITKLTVDDINQIWPAVQLLEEKYKNNSNQPTVGNTLRGFAKGLWYGQTAHHRTKRLSKRRNSKLKRVVKKSRRKNSRRASSTRRRVSRC